MWSKGEGGEERMKGMKGGGKDEGIGGENRMKKLGGGEMEN